MFDKFYLHQKKVVLVSFFQGKFYDAAFIFHIFMNLQRENEM